MLPQIPNGLTANGNLKTQVHQNLKSQFGKKLLKVTDLVETPNGDFAVAIAEADGTIVYARVDFVITTVDPMIEKPKTARKVKPTDTVEVPEI